MRRILPILGLLALLVIPGAQASGVTGTTQTSISATFDGLQCGTSYTLTLSDGQTLTATTQACSATAVPTIPTGLAVTAGDGRVDLSWNANPSADQVDTYQVYRGDQNLNLNVAGTSYTDSTVTNGTQYCYRVSAHNAVGYGAWTSPAICVTPAGVPPPPPPNNCTATLAAGGNFASFVNSLPPGAVGCVHGGSYGYSPSSTSINTLSVNGTATNPITVESYPGETAKVGGAWQVNGSYLTFSHLTMDFANSSGPSGSCWNGHNVGVKIQGHDDTFNHVDAFSSLANYSQTAFLVLASNNTIDYSRIHNWGICINHDHGVYDQEGAGAQIHHNWFYDASPGSKLGFGWCVQFYPHAGGAHVYSNVCDNLGSGYVNCTSGSNNVVENNVVADLTGNGQSSGSLLDGCYPSGSGHIFRGNDQFHDPGGFGECGSDGAHSSAPGTTCSGNLPLDPQFADRANHNYTVLNPSLAGLGIWDGS